MKAEIVADSTANGIRLTTMSLVYPRFIHSEFMTHRVFSRNASSSRAIPVAKMIEQVGINPAIPSHWGKNQPGMQAREEVDGYTKGKAFAEWRTAAREAMKAAERMNALGIHKQVVNRILEPYQFMSTVVTATEWKNFFDLRIHPDAQPEIKELAECMREAMDSSTPKELGFGNYHLPFVSKEEEFSLGTYDAIRCSVARCARVSYKNHDGSDPNVEKDKQLYNLLLASKHLSPFEHIARPMVFTDIHHDQYFWVEGVTHADRRGNLWSGNLRGWIQYRQTLDAIYSKDAE